MGCITEIIELQGKVERKDAHIDQLTNKLAEVTKDRDERAELAARLYSENQTLRYQLNQKQLEVEHCRVCCDELRLKMSTAVADALDVEADLMMAAPAHGQAAGNVWSESDRKVILRVGSMLKSRAALVRAKAGA